MNRRTFLKVSTVAGSGLLVGCSFSSPKILSTPDQEKNDAGLIAQEVQEVMPAEIRRAPFDYDPNEPNQSKSGEEFLTVQYEKMVPLLVEAIKEQQKQIDELKKLLEEKE